MKFMVAEERNVVCIGAEFWKASQHADERGDSERSV